MNVGGQVHVDAYVDMVRLVNDAFVIANNIAEEAHNIEFQDKVVRKENGGHTRQGVVHANDNDEGPRLHYMDTWMTSETSCLIQCTYVMMPMMLILKNNHTWMVLLAMSAQPCIWKEIMHIGEIWVPCEVTFRPFTPGSTR